MFKYRGLILSCNNMTTKRSLEDDTSPEPNQRVLNNLLWSLESHKLVNSINGIEDSNLKLTVKPTEYENVVEIVHAHNAHIHQYEIRPNSVFVDIRTSNLCYRGENDVRTRGDSYIVSIPPEVIDNSKISYEEDVEFYTRESEFLMTVENYVSNTEQDNAGNWEHRGSNTIRRSGSSYIVAIPPDVVRNTSFEIDTTAIFYSNSQLARVKDKNWVSSYSRTFSNH